MGDTDDEVMIGHYTRGEWAHASAVAGTAIGPIPDEDLSSHLLDFDHLMLRRQGDGSGAGGLEEAVMGKPEDYSHETRQLADEIWRIRHRYLEDYEEAVRALIDLVRREGLQLELVDDDGYFLIGPPKYR